MLIARHQNRGKSGEKISRKTVSKKKCVSESSRIPDVLTVLPYAAVFCAVYLTAIRTARTMVRQR